MASAVTKLATLTPSGTSTATFSGISGSYDDLKIIGSVKGDWTSGWGSAVTAFYIQFNGDTATNYLHLTNDQTGTTVGAVGQNSWSSYYLYAVASSFGSNTGWGHFEMYLPGYKVTTAEKRIQGIAGYTQGTNESQSNNGHGSWFNTPSAITDILFGLNYGDYVAGSTFTLYGITNS